MSGNRKMYTPEFREQAVRLMVDTGRPIARVAAEIRVGEQLLGRWVAAFFASEPDRQKCTGSSKRRRPTSRSYGWARGECFRRRSGRNTML